MMAEIWAREFGWVFHYPPADLRVITDMARVEENSPRKNFEAGIDLIKILYKEFKLPTRVLIFCGKIDRTKKIIQEK